MPGAADDDEKHNGQAAQQHAQATNCSAGQHLHAAQGDSASLSCCLHASWMFVTVCCTSLGHQLGLVSASQLSTHLSCQTAQRRKGRTLLGWAVLAHAGRCHYHRPCHHPCHGCALPCVLLLSSVYSGACVTRGVCTCCCCGKASTGQEGKRQQTSPVETALWIYSLR